MYRYCLDDFACSEMDEMLSTFSNGSPCPNVDNPDHFFGRRWIFKEINDHLKSNLPTNRGFVVTGAPGTGKSSLIGKLAKRGNIQ